ncbi:MAG: class I adenylate-forming enzyme family protein [Pseudomonadota bacterium]
MSERPSEPRSMIFHWAATEPGRRAAVENDVTFSYGELASGILYLRDAFAAMGLAPGSLAVVDVSSPLDNRLVLFALRALGVDVAPVHHASYIPELLQKPKAFLVLSAIETRSDIREAPKDCEDRVVLAPADLRQEMRRPRDPSAGPILLTGRHSVFSSGTTGRAKRVAFDSEYENRLHDHRAEQLGFSASTVIDCGAMGPWGVGGFRFPNCVWHIGGVAVFDNRVGQRRDIHAHGLTHFYTVPTALARFAHSWPAELRRADDVTILVAGGPVSTPVINAVTEKITRQIINVWGCSETTKHPMQRRFNGDPYELNWLDPVPGTTTELLREDGTPAAPGEAGIMRYLSEAGGVTRYEDDGEATARQFRDGAFYPGDLAVRRADGRIRFAGRDDDVLNVKGIKTPARPIEARLIDELAVDDVCIFVGLDDSGAEILVVCIESTQRVPKDALRTAAQHLAKQGKVAFSLHQAFPRGANGMGKVIRRHLRAEAFERLGMSEGAPTEV